MSTPRDNGSLDVALEDLRSVRVRVDALLAELNASEAAPEHMARQNLAPARFGFGFSEADELASAYAYIYHLLTRLSRSLAVQIEALGVSLGVGHETFADVDLDTRNRLLELDDRILRTRVTEPDHSDRGAQADLGTGSPG
jgi:hypothetical protein